MTVIVYSGNTIAYDSRLVAGETIVDDDYNKKRIVNNVSFIVSGSSSDYDDLINAYFGEKYDRSINPSAFVYDRGKVFIVGIYSNNEGFWKLDITGRKYTIGSGASHAWTALDLECTAVEAVQLTIRRNIYCGGKIRKLIVKKIKG